MTPQPEAIGPYKIVKPLGEGGQGVVYLARSPDGVPVAIKVLREGVAGDGRFAKEIAAARRVEPFCIAQVLDASLGARPYIVTEYVEGPSLHQAGPHAGADLQRLAVATVTALAAIHRAGVVHRDFKPANVLLGRDGPRVIDFGIARSMDDAVTRTSTIVGTPAYMAPEQFLGAPAGPAVDVFAWGSVIVYAATGAPPFGNDSLPAVLRRIQYEEPRLDGVPEPLRSIVYACLSKNPAARPAMQDVLFQLIGGGPAPARAPHPAAPASPVSGHPGSRVRSPAPGFSGGPAQSPARGFPDGPARPPVPGGPIHRPNPISDAHTGPTAPRSRNGLVLALLAGGTAIVVTGGVAVAWARLRTPSGTTSTAAVVTTHTSASATGKAKQSARPLQPDKTTKPPRTTSPRPTRTTPAPTRTPTRTPTRRPTRTPTAKPTTRPPTADAGGVTSVAFTYEGIRLGDCWRYDMNIWAKVSATGTYSYRWLVNGQNQGRQQGTSSARPLLPSITWKKAGTYQVAFEVITPRRSQKSLTVKICDFDKGW